MGVKQLHEHRLIRHHFLCKLNRSFLLLLRTVQVVRLSDFQYLFKNLTLPPLPIILNENTLFGLFLSN